MRVRKIADVGAIGEEQRLQRVGPGAVAGDFTDEQVRGVGGEAVSLHVLARGVGLAADAEVSLLAVEGEVVLADAGFIQ